MAKQMKPILRLLALGGIASVLAGCVGMGGSNYSCSGMAEDDSLRCMSTRDVYAATNDEVSQPAQVVSQRQSDETAQSGNGSRGTPRQHYTGSKSGGDETPATRLPASHGVDPMDVAANYVAPRLPDQPVPVRTPAQVMRVWIAPWESDSGDLMTVGYLYTEIEPRRWVLGESQGQHTQRSFSPLQ